MEPTVNAQQGKPTAAQGATTEPPMIVEIKAGQASVGLVGVFTPEEYRGRSIGELVQTTLNNQNMSTEDRNLATDVQNNLKNGKLLYKGNEVKGPAMQYAVPDKSEQGEDFLYVELRAIQPQEGGNYECSGISMNALRAFYRHLESKAN
jgi:hypothetical protein